MSNGFSPALLDAQHHFAIKYALDTDRDFLVLAVLFFLLCSF